MQDYIYSVIAFLAMAIHLIINSGMITGHAVANARGVRRQHQPLHCAALAVSLDCRMRLLV